MKRYILIAILFVFGRQVVRGQCPDAVRVGQRIREIKDLPTDQWLSACAQLKKQCENCRAVSDSNYADVLLLLGWAYSQQGSYDKSIDLTKASIRVNETNAPCTNPVDLIQACYYLGNYLRTTNQSTESFDAYQRSIHLGDSLSAEESVVVRSLIGQSLLLNGKGDYEQGLRKAEQGFQMAVPLHDNLLSAECQVEIAWHQLELGNLSKAGINALAAIRLVDGDPYGSDVEMVTRLLLARTYQRQNKVGDALRQYEQAIVLCQKNGLYSQIAHVYNSVGYLYLKNLRDYNKAQLYFRRAHDQYQEAHNRALSTNNIGIVYREQGHYEEALVYLQRALNELPIAFGEQTVTRNPAAKTIRLITFKEIPLSIIQDKADTWLDYAGATGNNRQRLRYALDTYRVADQMIDFMRWEHTGQQSKLFWRQKTRSMYERAIETCYRLGDTEQAFRFFEKSRAVMLADKLAELGARRQLPPQQAKAEERLRQSVSDQQRKLVELPPASSVYAPARTALLTKQDSLDAFLKQLEASNPAYYRYKYDNATPSLSDLQGYLRTRRASFVTYFVGDSALYLLGVTGNGATLLRQPVSTYDRDVRVFLTMLANADALNRKADVARFLTLGNGLYRRLLAPLKLADDRVIVSPDGLFVPLDALSRSADTPDYLVQHYALSYAYSASLLLKDDGSKSPVDVLRGSDFLGVAPVRFAATLKQIPLIGSDDALRSVAERFRSPALLLKEAATRRAFLTQAPAYRVIQLFTHAAADSTDREPVLYFADSTLRLSELGDGTLPNAQLAVLTACQTGIGANQRGEGVFSLARGFAALGVASVVSTLWSVEDEATYKLTNLFYQYLDEGLPKDVALQRAKLDWLTQSDRPSPTQWAGLILVGDAQSLERPARWLWVAGGAGLLLAAGVVLWRRRRRAL